MEYCTKTTRLHNKSNHWCPPFLPSFPFPPLVLTRDCLSCPTILALLLLPLPLHTPRPIPSLLNPQSLSTRFSSRRPLINNRSSSGTERTRKRNNKTRTGEDTGTTRPQRRNFPRSLSLGFSLNPADLSIRNRPISAVQRYSPHPSPLPLPHSLGCPPSLLSGATYTRLHPLAFWLTVFLSHS